MSGNSDKSSNKTQSDKTCVKKRVRKNKLRSKTCDDIRQCISCGLIIDNGEYCDDATCKFDTVKRSSSISYTNISK